MITKLTLKSTNITRENISTIQSATKQTNELVCPRSPLAKKWGSNLSFHLQKPWRRPWAHDAVPFSPHIFLISNNHLKSIHVKLWHWTVNVISHGNFGTPKIFVSTPPTLMRQHFEYSRKQWHMEKGRRGSTITKTISKYTDTILVSWASFCRDRR